MLGLIHSSSAVIAWLSLVFIPALLPSVLTGRRMKRLKPRNVDTPGAPLKKMKQQVEESWVPDEVARGSGEGKHSFFISFFVMSANCDIFRSSAWKRTCRRRGGRWRHYLSLHFWIRHLTYVPLIGNVVRFYSFHFRVSHESLWFLFHRFLNCTFPQYVLFHPKSFLAPNMAFFWSFSNRILMVSWGQFAAKINCSSRCNLQTRVLDLEMLAILTLGLKETVHRYMGASPLSVSCHGIYTHVLGTEIIQQSAW